MQWNCKGLLKNLDDVYELFISNQPIVMCLQDTHLNSKQTKFVNDFGYLGNTGMVVGHLQVVWPSCPKIIGVSHNPITHHP